MLFFALAFPIHKVSFLFKTLFFSIVLDTKPASTILNKFQSKLISKQILLITKVKPTVIILG